MRKNSMKAKLAAGKPVIGSWVLYDWPEMVEWLGLVGFDYVAFDAEHGYKGLREIAGLVRAAENVDITPLARVPRNAPDVILGYLDAGVQGIIVPHTETREQAEQAVKAVKYYPEGERGCGYGHSLEHGLRQPFPEYAVEANRETMVICQCESKLGLENLEEIVKLSGVDFILWGPNDFSQTLGFPGQLNHPLVQEAGARAEKIVRAAGKHLMQGYPDPEKARRAIGEGARVISIGVRPLFTSAAKAYLAKARGQA